jgi:acyl dehydratase
MAPVTTHTYASAECFAVQGPGTDLDDWRGRTVTVHAPFPVEAGRVADFCGMLRDDNPLYWDRELATRRYGRPIAPPAMLTAWRFAAPWNPAGRPEHGPPIGCEVPLPADTLINVGLTCQFSGPLYIGDRLTYVDTISAISERKQTSLGTGWFLTTDSAVTDQDGRQVATYQNVMFRYQRPAEPEGAPPVAAQAQAAADQVAAPGAGGLPDIVIPITPTLCAQITAATRDYFPGHHDPGFARGQGVAGAYPNTGFYCGLADAVAVSWAGHQAHVVARALRMVRPAPVGETLHTRGTVLERSGPDGDGRTRLGIDVISEGGPVARAEVTIQLDREADR